MRHIDRDALAAYVSGDELDTAAEQHLGVCSTCRAELDAFAVAAVRIRSSRAVPSIEPPPARLWDRILAEVGSTNDVAATETECRPVNDRSTAVDAQPGRSGLHPAGRSAAGSWRRRWSRRAAVAAVVVAAVVGSGATIVVLRPWASGSSSSQVRFSGALAPLPGQPSAASGQLTVRPRGSGMQLRVATRALPTPTGFYEVWLIDPESGRAVPVGDLPPGGTADFPMPSGVDVQQYRVVNVSAEPYDGNPAPSTVSLLRGTLQR